MSALSSITGLIPRVILRCPGITQEAALVALKTVAIDFCERTHSWKEVIDITLVEDQVEYTLTPAADGAIVHRVISVMPLNEDDERQAYTPESAFWYDYSTGKLNYIPEYAPNEDQDGLTVQVTVALKPEWIADSDDYPVWIMEKYGRGLAGGAAVEILSRPPFDLPVNHPRVKQANIDYANSVMNAKAENIRLGRPTQTGYAPS